MAYDILLLPVTILFISSGFGLFYYASKLNKKFPKEHNFINCVLTFLLWIIAGLIYPFYLSIDNPHFKLFQILSIFFICIFTPFLIFSILFYQHRIVLRNNPDIKEKRNIKEFLIRFDKQEDDLSSLRFHKIKTDIHRKALHLFPAGIIIFLWIFAVYIWDGLSNADEVWKITGQQFSRFLILTAGYSGILIFGALDYIRLSFIFENHNLFHLIPDNVLNLLGKTMKRNENYNYIKPLVLALSFAPIFIFPFGIFAAASLIATLGDGAASVVGLRFGKIHFPKSSEKTIAGNIAGFLASFLIAFISLWLFESSLKMFEIFLISFSGATTFFIIDVTNHKIDDNILNPILSALIMGLLYYIL
jgi:dolichol kinase